MEYVGFLFAKSQYFCLMNEKREYGLYPYSLFIDDIVFLPFHEFLQIFLYSQAVLYEIGYASPSKQYHTSGETYSRIAHMFLLDDSQDVDEIIYCLL